MQLLETATGPSIRSRAMTRPPFGPGFTTTEAEGAMTMEVYGSSFKELGGDYCLFVLRNQDGTIIAQKRVSGY